MFGIGEAKADVLGGSTITSGIVVLNFLHDSMPFWSTIGIVCGTILAIHGVYELVKTRYFPWFKNRFKK